MIAAFRPSIVRRVFFAVAIVFLLAWVAIMAFEYWRRLDNAAERASTWEWMQYELDGLEDLHDKHRAFTFTISLEREFN
jgi:hypothetical protein